MKVTVERKVPVPRSVDTARAKKARKAVVPVLGAAVGAAVVAYFGYDATISVAVVGALSALGVYVVPNQPVA